MKKIEPNGVAPERVATGEAIALAMQSATLQVYCGGTFSETCACGGGWFNGVHVTHRMIRAALARVEAQR